MKRIYESECEGRRLRGRHRKEWKDGVEEYLIAGGININGVHRLVRDRDEWKKFVRGGNESIAPFCSTEASTSWLPTSY